MLGTSYHMDNIDHLEVVGFKPTLTPADPVTTASDNKVKWSSTLPVPAIGERVALNTEWVGGVITGYFIEYGWLGFYFKPETKPAWWVRQQQKGGRSTEVCMGFGCDIVAA